jgi:hypothetical protein
MSQHPRQAATGGQRFPLRHLETNSFYERRVQLVHAVGAILKFAVTAQVAGISVSTVGLILMVAGAIGLFVSLWLIAIGCCSANRSS